jgi:5-methylcytosine-specific restriction enzyme subunit McrC
LLTETVRHHPVVRDRHWCAFTEFTADILENRILKLACITLLPYPYKKVPDLGRRLRRLLRVFANVQLDTWAGERFGQLVYHRLNEHYRPSLALARLLLSYLSLSGSRGPHQFLAFLVDMNALFEQYVTAVLQEAMAFRNGWVLTAQDPRTLDLDRRVIVRPDIVLYHKDMPVLALDAKYKLQEHNADIYQALAYCHALGIGQAILAYPASEGITPLRHRIRPDADVEVDLLPLDLSGGLADLKRQTQAFVDAVWREATFAY